MAKTKPFERHAEAYEQWFERNAERYASELEAVRRLMPGDGTGALEVGVGSGRFAAPLGIRRGVEPSRAMARRAVERGIRVCAGVAERLPFLDERFGLVLMVTTICFVDDLPRSLREARRVLKPGGRVLLGFVDRESGLGRRYERRRAESRFYREATFYSATEVRSRLEEAGFVLAGSAQTLMPGEPSATVRDGFGEGAFVVLEGRKDPQRDVNQGSRHEGS